MDFVARDDETDVVLFRLAAIFSSSLSSLFELDDVDRIDIVVILLS